jgi:hypothetical protein
MVNFMGGIEWDHGAEYLRELGRVARRARLIVVLRRLVPGSLAGLAAGFVYLVVRPFLPPAFTLFHPLVVPGLLLAAGSLAGVAVGCAVPIGRPALAVQVDRSLGTRGLASAALEVAEGRRSSAFAAPLLEDAASGLRRAGPRRIVAAPRLRLLPWTLAAAALVTAAGLLPFTLRDLFPARQPVDARLAVLGGELEESGRRLEQESRRKDLRQGLELSRELQQLGKALSMQEGSAEELSQRLSELENRIGQAYELMLQRFPDQAHPAGTGSDSEPASGGGDLEPVPGSGHEDPGGQALEKVDPSTLPPEARELAEALGLLQQLKERSASKGGSGGDGERGGPPGKPGAEGEGSGTAAGDETAGNEGDPNASPKAGTAAVTDEPGPPSEIARSEPGAPLKAESPVGEGEMARMLVRALPEATGAVTAEEQVLGEYRQQAEGALAAEQVPLVLREYVKGYFTGIGMLQD